MKELHFRPKGMARNLRNSDLDKSIGIIIKDLNYPFYTSIALGAKDYANRKGYSVVVASSENDHEGENESPSSSPPRISKGPSSPLSSRGPQRSSTCSG
jgi:DNA-binding LacI/PurR family transcriptional regulator